MTRTADGLALNPSTPANRRPAIRPLQPTPDGQRATARPSLVSRPGEGGPGERRAPADRDMADESAMPEPGSHDSPADKPARASLSRGAILDATLDCLLEAGYDGTTIRAIAKRLNCAVGSIYRYFADKRDLLAEVTERRFAEAVEAAQGEGGFEQSVRLYARAAAESPELYRLMFWLASIGCTRPTRAVPTAVEQLVEAWADRLGGLDAARQCWTGLHGRLMLGAEADEAAAEALRTHAATGQGAEPSWRASREASPALRPVIVRPETPTPIRDDADDEQVGHDDGMPGVQDTDGQAAGGARAQSVTEDVTLL